MHSKNRESVSRGLTGVAALAIILVTLFQTSALMAAPKDIVYIEASTVNRWKLKEFGKRVNDDQFQIEPVTLYDFDKTPRVNAALTQRPAKPDAIVMQECSVYFPGDMKSYKEKYQSWIHQIKQSGVTPVIATIVPPADSQGFVEDMKAFVKVKVLRQASQHQQITEFNDWLRELARNENVPLFDLEKYTRRSDTDRRMREEYNSGDGIHVNATAYSMLDKELLTFLRALK